MHFILIFTIMYIRDSLKIDSGKGKLDYILVIHNCLAVFSFTKQLTLWHTTVLSWDEKLLHHSILSLCTCLSSSNRAQKLREKM